VLLLGLTACAVVGALTTPAYVVLVLAPLLGVFVAGVVAILSIASVDAASVRRPVLLSGAWAALLVPALAGAGVFGTGGAVLMFGLMVLGVVVCGHWIVESCDPDGEQGEPGTDEEQLRQLLRVLPTSMLLREWRSTVDPVRLGAEPERRARAVRLRTLLLEELTRRDPAGVARWLIEGDEDSPEHYLRGDSSASP
jgi:hypothetical protein